MITVFESIGNLVNLIIGVVIQSHGIDRILFSMLNFNLLPYIFLVNTRENKNRLVLQGWPSVLRDSIPCMHIPLPWNRNNRILPFEQVKYDVNNGICIISKNQQHSNHRTLSLQMPTPMWPGAFMLMKKNSRAQSNHNISPWFS